MTVFVILAIVLSLAVLLAVLWPLWREARGLVIAGVATLGIATFALYRVVGTPGALAIKRGTTLINAATVASSPATPPCNVRWKLGRPFTTTMSCGLGSSSAMVRLSVILASPLTTPTAR